LAKPSPMAASSPSAAARKRQGGIEISSLRLL